MPSDSVRSKRRSSKHDKRRSVDESSVDSLRGKTKSSRSKRRSTSVRRKHSPSQKRRGHSSDSNSESRKKTSRLSKHLKRDERKHRHSSREREGGNRKRNSRSKSRSEGSDRRDRSHKDRTARSHKNDRSRDTGRDRYKDKPKSHDQPKPFMVPMLDNKDSSKHNASKVYVQDSVGNVNLGSSFDIKYHQAQPQPDQRKRRSRWTENETGRIYIPGLPTTLPANLTKDQEKAYLLQLQIEEITRRLRLPNLGIPENPSLRSPSPEPIYDQYGKRSNTREARTRKKLDDDRHLLILDMYKLNPEYKPPMDYKPQQIKYTDKVDIPQDDFPEINFVGLLIGPRGNSLKSLEKETGAKIIIRGRGSVKDGKLARKEAGPLPGEDEPLHAYITGTTIEVVERAKKRIHEIIQQGIEVPESMNELRRTQLRELALLNGTLRENECLNKLKILTEAETILTNTIICPICGNAGHIASDCLMKGSLTKEQLDILEKACVDTEYSALMKELGHTVSATQLKCLSSVIARGSLTSGITGLALPSTEIVNEDGETEVTMSLSSLTGGNNIPDDEIPPLMPSGRLVIPPNAKAGFGPSNTTYQSFMSSNAPKRLITPSENLANSFFAETAQKWINDSVFTDPTIAIAAAALSQYAYHPNPTMQSPMARPGHPSASDFMQGNWSNAFQPSTYPPVSMPLVQQPAGSQYPNPGAPAWYGVPPQPPSCPSGIQSQVTSQSQLGTAPPPPPPPPPTSEVSAT